MEHHACQLLPGPLPQILWPLPQLPLARLGTARVHLWVACPDSLCEFISALEPVLSPEEKARASRYKSAKRRADFTVQIGLLRWLLSQYRTVAPADHKFTCGAHGKPELETSKGLAPLHFNLSHSDSLVLYAFTPAAAVGVDIERIRPMDDWEDIAGRFFTPGETAALRALSPGQRQDGFFNCWTRKEAILKATGAGITGGLDTVEVTLRPGDPARVLNLHGPQDGPNPWSLHHLSPAPGYVAALAYCGAPLELQCWSISPTILRRL